MLPFLFSVLLLVGVSTYHNDEINVMPLVTETTGISIEKNTATGLTEIHLDDNSVLSLDVQPVDYTKMND